MKKFVFIAVLVFCCVLSVNAQDIVYLRLDCQHLGLRGAVATMDEDVLIRKDYFREDWDQRKWFLRDLRSVLREDEGRILAFNPAGRMTSITYTKQGVNGKTTLCSYDSKGNLVSMLGEGYKIVGKYNGCYGDINVYAESHDNNGRLVYPFDMKCRQELTDEGYPLWSRYYYVDSMPARTCEYSYNHRDQLVEERITDFSTGSQVKTVVRYTYDNQGFLIKKVTHGKSVDETRTYENNELGDCVRMTVALPYDTTVYTFEYKYDDQQNWVARLRFDNGVFNSATLRSLTYHKVAAKPVAKAEKKQKTPKATPVKSKAKDPVVKAPKDKSAKTSKSKAPKDKPAKDKGSKKQKTPKAKRDKVSQTADPVSSVQPSARELERQQRLEAKRSAAEQQRAKKKEEASAKKAERERLAAEKKAKKEQEMLAKKAEKERIAAEKKAKKEQEMAAKKAKKQK